MAADQGAPQCRGGQAAAIVTLTTVLTFRHAPSIAAMTVPGPIIRRPATYQDVLDAPPTNVIPRNRTNDEVRVVVFLVSRIGIDHPSRVVDQT